jgi:hypothetical protein
MYTYIDIDIDTIIEVSILYEIKVSRSYIMMDSIISQNEYIKENIKQKV